MFPAGLEGDGSKRLVDANAPVRSGTYPPMSDRPDSVLHCSRTLNFDSSARVVVIPTSTATHFRVQHGVRSPQGFVVNCLATF